MWIVNKEIDYMTELRTLALGDNEKGEYCVIVNDDEVCGKYSSVDRAKEVIKEIIRRVEVGVRVYIMPKE